MHKRFSGGILSIGLLCGLFAFSAPAQGQSSLRGSQYSLHGVTVYDPAVLLNYAAHAALQSGAAITAESLSERIEVIYREDGYFLTDVVVAPDGKHLVVDEGAITEIVIEGVDEKTYRLIKSYMSKIVGKRPLKQRDFERAVMLVEDIGSISATVEVEFDAGARAYKARVIASEAPRSRGYATLDNPPRELGEASILTLNQEFIGLLTPGDLLRLEAAGTLEYDGSNHSLWGNVMYRAPIGSYGSYIEGYFGTVTAHRDRSGNLLSTDIKGDTAIIAVGHPVIRDIDTYGYALAEARRTTSDDEVGGTDFDSGVYVGGLSWIYGKALAHGGAVEYALNLSGGHRYTNAATFEDGDEDFYHIRAGVGVEHPVDWLGPHTVVRAEAWGQFTTNSLPAIEKFYIGGREEERGYLVAEAIGDNGVSGTLELSRDFFPDNFVRRVRPFGFVDIGYVENNDPLPGTLRSETFASVGLGVDLELPGSSFLRGYIALPTTGGLSTDAGDPAFYLGLTKSW